MLSLEEIQKIMLEEEERVAGRAAAVYLQEVMLDPILNRIHQKGYDGEIALQIRERYYKKDWDYQTPVGSVISGVVFDERGTHQREPIHSNPGRNDFPVTDLTRVSEHTLVRPKLPGQLMTRQEVIGMGRRTCFDLVERVGDELYGLYPLQPCGCCVYNEPVPLKDYVCKDWHEGLMVFLNGKEYRTRKYEVQDKICSDGIVWEMEKQGDEWIKVKPRGVNKLETPPRLQITTPMIMTVLCQEVERKDTSARWMSKAAVLSSTGWYFHIQASGWDMVGGKQELDDIDHFATMSREYKEEVGTHITHSKYLGSEKTDDFTVHYYFVYDPSIKSSYRPDLLRGVQAKSWQKCMHLLDRKLKQGMKFLPPAVKRILKARGLANLLYSRFILTLPLHSMLEGPVYTYVSPLDSSKTTSIQKLLDESSDINSFLVSLVRTEGLATARLVVRRRLKKQAVFQSSSHLYKKIWDKKVEVQQSLSPLSYLRNALEMATLEDHGVNVKLIVPEVGSYVLTSVLDWPEFEVKEDLADLTSLFPFQDYEVEYGD